MHWRRRCCARAGRCSKTGARAGGALSSRASAASLGGRAAPAPARKLEGGIASGGGGSKGSKGAACALGRAVGKEFGKWLVGKWLQEFGKWLVGQLMGRDG